MSNFQIRIRTDVEWEQLNYISEWLEKAARGFAFEHKKPDNHHYHVYLFGLERNDDAMRRHLGKHLPNKECYAVSKTCGKKKKRPVEPQGAYTYGTTKALINHIWFKGFTNDMMENFHHTAKDFHKTGVGQSNERSEAIDRPVRVPYQQAVIAYAAAEWINHKRACKEKGEEASYVEVIDFVCKGMREYNKGINPYMVRELAYAVLHDDLEFRERILKKIKCEFIV